MKASPSRIRWYSIRPFERKLLKKLTDGMLATNFNPEVGFGFVMGDIRPSSIMGRFIRKERICRTITHPDGAIEEVQFDDFSSSSFTVSSSDPHLELTNPSRRIAELLTVIGDLLDDRVAIIPMEVECERWLEALTRNGCTVIQTRLVTEDIALTDSVSVKAAFSGTRDVRGEARSFLKRRNLNAEAVFGSLECEGHTAKIKISRGGALTFLSTPSNELLQAVRKSASSLTQESA